MKNFITLVFLLFTFSLFSQVNYINVCEDCDNLYHTFDFNDSNDSTSFFFNMDASQANNIWEVGTTAKSTFNSGYYAPKALVTDTLSTYPINNVSSFEFAMKHCSWNTSGNCGGYEILLINIISKIDTDLHLDGGTIEVSHNGSPWINIIEDNLATVTGDIYALTDTIASMNKPGYSGTSSDWNYLNITFKPEMNELFDTITLRFTFSSDMVETNKDGWMIGLIQMGGVFVGMEEIYSSDLINVFPNPSSNKLFISSKNESELNGELSITNSIGQMVYFNNNFSSNYIDISKFSEGLYVLRFSDGNNYTTSKFIKK